MKDCFYIDNHILVVAKPRNIKMEEFKQQIKQDLQNENYKNSFVEELFPVSKEESGIVVFCLSSKAQKRLEMQKQETLLVRHFAICVGMPKYKNKITYIDETDETKIDEGGQFVHRNAKTNKLELIPSLYSDAVQIFDDYSVLETNKQISLVRIDGGLNFEDEVRFVMNDAKSPIFGDKLYDGETLAKNTNLALSVVEVKFVHPTSNKNMSFRYYPETDKKPWSYFNVEKYLKI